MIEIVFSRSAAGSLKQSRHYGEGPFAGQVGVVFSTGDSVPSEEEVRRAQEKAQHQHRKEWENAVSMGDALGEVFSLSLALSVGDIAADPFGFQRRNVFSSLMAEFPPDLETASEMLEQAKQNFNTVLERAGAGEELRIWYSGLPDDQCALRWFFDQLCQSKSTGKICLVELPSYKVRADGVVVQYQGWGEVGPGEWASFVPLQKDTPANLRSAMAQEWQTLQKENTPLRAMINGQIYSVAEDFYDPFILRELEAQPQEFHQAQFIAKILEKYRLGISDGWIALRMETWIQQGLLEVASELDKSDSIIYRRYLRKTKAF